MNDMMMDRLASYRAMCAAKRVEAAPRGLARVPALNSTLFPHQAHGVEFGLRAGSAALFYDTGLGKTAMMHDWGRCVVEATNKPVLMLAPLAVGSQHIREADRLGIDAVQSRDGSSCGKPRIVIANYERLEKFDPDAFGGVILDESSILKSFSGVTTRKLIGAFRAMRFRLAGSATPAPNDYTELGNHSDFLGVMKRDEMLVRWFIHDSANTKDWRIKGHAVGPYWDWVASWARCVSKPSDLGFSDDGFTLPPIDVRQHIIVADRGEAAGEEKDGQARLFRTPDMSATSTHREKRLTKDARAEKAASIVADHPSEPVVIWVDTDYEADAVRDVVPDAIEVHGRMSADEKEARLDAFSRGEIRILLTKPSIAGFGLNWQHCRTTIFCGLSFSYEGFYQAVRRFWRFGQTMPVTAHVVIADTEASIAAAVARKQGDHSKMKREMAAAMSRAARLHETLLTYSPTVEAALPAWLQQ